MDLPRFYLARHNSDRSIGVILWTSEGVLAHFAEPGIDASEDFQRKLGAVRSFAALEALFAPPFSLALGGEYQQPIRGSERRLVLDQLVREFLGESSREPGSVEPEAPIVCLMDGEPLEEMPAGNKSVYVEFTSEYDRHKWIETGCVNYDLGEDAVRRWVRDHWHGFLRHKWIDHLEGREFWVELDRGDFGLLQREFQDQRPLLKQILNLMKQGHDNLGVLMWAHANDVPTEAVVPILQALDVNSHRLSFRWDR